MAIAYGAGVGGGSSRSVLSKYKTQQLQAEFERRKREQEAQKRAQEQARKQAAATTARIQQQFNQQQVAKQKQPQPQPAAAAFAGYAGLAQQLGSQAPRPLPALTQGQQADADRYTQMALQKYPSGYMTHIPTAPAGPSAAQQAYTQRLQGQATAYLAQQPGWQAYGQRLTELTRRKYPEAYMLLANSIANQPGWQAYSDRLYEAYNKWANQDADVAPQMDYGGYPDWGGYGGYGGGGGYSYNPPPPEWWLSLTNWRI
jgi:hypothetical protein